MGNETVETVYGSVEVDTVECDSCGDTILRDDAYRFRMGPPSNKGMSSVEYNGYACEHCAEVGPASFPERAIEYTLPRDEWGDFWIYLIAAPVFFPALVLGALFSDDEFITGYFIAIASVTVWVAALLLVFH